MTVTQLKTKKVLTFSLLYKNEMGEMQLFYILQLNFHSARLCKVKKKTYVVKNVRAKGQLISKELFAVFI